MALDIDTMAGSGLLSGRVSAFGGPLPANQYAKVTFFV
jgi:hypothetical protein